MFFHDVPFEGSPVGAWVLNMQDGLVRCFRSRHAALAFASDDAAEQERCGAKVAIRVEGADGVWRTFDAQMKGLPYGAWVRHG